MHKKSNAVTYRETNSSFVPPLIHIRNDETDMRAIIGGNFWESGAEYLLLSSVPGAFRLLVPTSLRSAIEEMRKDAKAVVISMLSPTLWEQGQYCVEWFVEDGSRSPWVAHLCPDSVALTPQDEATFSKISEFQSSQLLATVWEEKNGVPNKCLELPCQIQIVPEVPWGRGIA